jgi:hypothetical protein
MSGILRVEPPGERVLAVLLRNVYEAHVVPTIRFRLRSVMILVALIAVGLWVAITVARVCAAMVMLLSESVVVVQPAYLIMVLAVVAALFLITVGVISFVFRLRAILRNSSQRFDHGRRNW